MVRINISSVHWHGCSCVYVLDQIFVANNCFIRIFWIRILYPTGYEEKIPRLEGSFMECQLPRAELPISQFENVIWGEHLKEDTKDKSARFDNSERTGGKCDQNYELRLQKLRCLPSFPKIETDFNFLFKSGSESEGLNCVALYKAAAIAKQGRNTSAQWRR